MSIHNLGFRILGFYHRVQWRGAKTVRKECWGPCPCHGLIPSLWDFAQNYSLQIELRNQNWRGKFYFLDKPWISKVFECWVQTANMRASVKKPPMFDSLYPWSWDANAIPDTLFFPCFSQFWSQTRKPKIPDEEFQSDTPRSAKPRKFKKRREISNVGWSHLRVNRGLESHSCGKIAVWQLCRGR